MDFDKVLNGPMETQTDGQISRRIGSQTDGKVIKDRVIRE